MTVASATPEATQCDGSAGRSFRPALPFDGLDGAAGATLAIADSTGDSVTVPFPVASFETANGGFSGRLHLRNLPTAGTTQVGNGGSLPVDRRDLGRLRQRVGDRDARRDRRRHVCDRRQAVPRRHRARARSPPT